LLLNQPVAQHTAFLMQALAVVMPGVALKADGVGLFGELRLHRRAGRVGLAGLLLPLLSLLGLGLQARLAIRARLVRGPVRPRRLQLAIAPR
jgi:hypothetical protein